MAGWQPYDDRGRPNTPKSNPKDVGALAEPLRSRVAAMIADCPHKGELGLVSGYRDPGTQWDLRLERVGLANIWRADVKGSPTTAVPAKWNYQTQRWEGGSHHQTGEAADFGGTERAMVWMHDHRESYGLARTVSSERWHMEANRRDVLTGRVHDRPTVPIPPYGGSHPPTTTPAPKDWLMALTDQQQKDLYDAVMRLDDFLGHPGQKGRQVLANIDKRTADIADGKRPVKKD